MSRRSFRQIDSLTQLTTSRMTSSIGRSLARRQAKHFVLPRWSSSSIGNSISLLPVAPPTNATWIASHYEIPAHSSPVLVASVGRRSRRHMHPRDRRRYCAKRVICRRCTKFVYSYTGLLACPELVEGSTRVHNVRVYGYSSLPVGRQVHEYTIEILSCITQNYTNPPKT